MKTIAREAFHIVFMDPLLILQESEYVLFVCFSNHFRCVRRDDTIFHL